MDTQTVEKKWFKTKDGRMIYRSVPSAPVARSTLPCPMVISDTLDEPVQSPADGNFYTSKSALRATYKPSGNPQGESYLEVGNEAFKPSMPEYVPDKKGIEEAIGKAFQQVGSL